MKFSLVGGVVKMDFDFSSWLRHEMAEQNISNNKLSKETGIHHCTISCFANGQRNPTLGTFMALLKAFGKKIVIVDEEDSDA